jgi:hypothetical protein
VSNRIHKTARTAAIAGSVLMVGSMLSGTANAADNGFKFEDSSYILTLRSAGIEAYSYIPRLLTEEVGHSYVDLIHDTGQPKGRCETIGAGYWLGQELEEGVLGPGAAPPDAGDVSGGYRNPTISRDVAPNISAEGNESARDPGVRNYFPPGNEVVDIPAESPGNHWTAKCIDDASGEAQGDVARGGPGQIVGSVAKASVDKATGVYTGTSRAYVYGLEGQFDGMSSFMQVVNKPNEKPIITYRMTYFNSGENKDKNGISFGGSQVPVEAFADNFNKGAEAFTAAAKPVGPNGAQTLKPQVGLSTDGGRFSISISSAVGWTGAAAREGTAGQEQGARFGSVTFEGIYGGEAGSYTQPNL